MYEPIDRCGGERSRDVQWEGGFRQPLLSKGQFDALFENTNSCPYRSMVGEAEWFYRANALSNGAYCEDRTWQISSPKCDLGENAQSCGVHRHLVVFGFSALFSSFRTPRDDFYKADERCVALADGLLRENVAECADGGPGSVEVPVCYFGTHAKCPKRRFAFLPEDAGPDVPDDSCPTARNGDCEDGLMWSIYPPGKNPCPPNSDARLTTQTTPSLPNACSRLLAVE